MKMLVVGLQVLLLLSIPSLVLASHALSRDPYAAEVSRDGAISWWRMDELDPSFSGKNCMSVDGIS